MSATAACDMMTIISVRRDLTVYLAFPRRAGRGMIGCQKSLIDRLDNWLDSPEIEQVAIWSSERVAHAADLAARGDTGGDVLTVETVAIAQRLIVRAAEAVWAYLDRRAGACRRHSGVPI